MTGAETKRCSLCGEPTDPLGIHELNHTIKEWSDEVTRLREEIEKYRDRETILREMAMQDRVVMEAEVTRWRDEVAWLRTWIIKLSPGAMERIEAALACECEEPMDLEAFLESANPVVHREGCPAAALDVASTQEVAHD